MQMQVAAVARTSRLGFRGIQSAFRGAPIIPVAIVFVLAITAIFGDFIIDLLPTRIDDCPGNVCAYNPADKYNPEAGNLRERHYPPFWVSTVVRGITGPLLLSLPRGQKGPETDLNEGVISPEFRQAFASANIPLPDDAKITVNAPGLGWSIEGTTLIIKAEDDRLNVRDDLGTGPVLLSFPKGRKGHETDLNEGVISPDFRQAFASANVPLPDDATIFVNAESLQWAIEGTTLIINVSDDGEQLDVADSKTSGDRHHILGTDRLGRDVLARLIVGGRLSLMIAAISIAVSALLGTSLGLIAGYYGKWVDAFLMRLVDLSLAFPAILLALVFAVALGPNIWWVVIVLVLIRWAHFARLARGETLSLKERDFVALARVAGAPTYRIIAIHIFPNLVNSIVVLGTLHVGSAIIVEATLSFLGAGVPPPTPTWGEMIAGDRQFVRTAWWVSSAAGIAIALTVLSFNLLGDWLRDRLDPGLRTL